MSTGVTAPVREFIPIVKALRLRIWARTVAGDQDTRDCDANATHRPPKEHFEDLGY
jgi:hypothetical protein